jgi:hypothetical protein
LRAKLVVTAVAWTDAFEYSAAIVAKRVEIKNASVKKPPM